MRLFVDRLEAGVVVVTDGRRSFELPAGLFATLPREGDVLIGELRVDEEATRRARVAVDERRRGLSRDDDGGDFSL